MSMRNINYRSAIRFALSEEMSRDDRVFLIGEDIGAAGGVFKVTEGLIDDFGPKRVIDTPISETAIIGAALGAALGGLIPVAELMFSDFACVAMDQIVNQIAKKAYLSSGHEKVQLVIRMVTGGGVSFGPQHSQSLEAWFGHVPGLVTVMPSDPRTAKGMLKSSIRSGKPVLFFEHKALYSMQGSVPEEEELLAIGKSEVVREGNDLTIVGGGSTVKIGLDCADKLEAEQGISAEVVDLRTLSPLDSATIFRSIEKTGRLLIIEDDVGFLGWGSEIAAQAAENVLYSLKAPVRRVSAPYSPIPFSPVLEAKYLPNSNRAFDVALKLVKED
jgi:pyruvate/2-oxoglutarate/acetoin dehydrogenase E1 component